MTTQLRDKEEKQQSDEEDIRGLKEQLQEKDKKIEEMMVMSYMAIETAGKEQLEREKSKQENESKKELEKECARFKKECEDKMSVQELTCLERLAEFQERTLDLENKL